MPDPKASKKKRGKKPGGGGVDITEHAAPLDRIVAFYGTDLDTGLADWRVVDARKKYGPNELTPPKKTPGIVKFFRITTHGFSLLLWAGSVMCFIAFAIDSSQKDDPALDNLYLGIVLAAVVLITSVFTYYQEAKSDAIMEGFKKMVPQKAEVMREGEKVVIMASELVPGDVVFLRHGARVPADVLVLEAAQLKVDNSSLTGESRAISKGPEMTSADPLETKNLAFFSTNIVKGTGKGLVVRTGDKTAVGRIASLATRTQTEDTPIRKEIAHFVCIISAVAVALGVTFGAVAAIVGYSPIDSILFLIGIIVANVPEGLLATVTVALTLTAQKMAKKNCLVRRIEAVETLGSTGIICTDKTGTITQNRMTVTHIWENSKLTKLDTTVGSYGKGFNLGEMGWKELSTCAALCSVAVFKPNQDHVPVLKREVDGDGTEAAILKMCEGLEPGVEKFRERNPRVAEIPFNSTTKYHVSIHAVEGGGGHHLFMKGAPERVIALCSTVLDEGASRPKDAAFQKSFEEMYAHIGSLGERVLGFCDLPLPRDAFPPGYNFDTDSDPPNFPMEGFRFLGLLGLVDPPKPSVKDAVEKCRSAGIRVVMVTGDHPLTAKAIAKQVGIISEDSKTPEEVAAEENISPEDVAPGKARARVIKGQELASWSRERLLAELDGHPEVVFARTSPEQKLDIVEANQRGGAAVVAVTGDGVNDSPALKKADIGISMGITGSDVSKEAADMILLDDNFASIVCGVEEGRLIFDNLKKSIVYTLTSNIPEITPFLAFIIAGIPLPLGTITILFIDLGTDMIPAISLAYEKPERDIMKRQPRDPKKDRLVNQRLIFLAYFIVGVIQAAAGFLLYFIIMAEHGFLPDRLWQLREEWDTRPDSGGKEKLLEDSYGRGWTYKRRKELEYTCHTGFFFAIVQVQWTDLLISKTRMVSLFEQGMWNCFLNFALVFETALAMLLIYIPGTEVALRLFPLNPIYFIPALPYAAMIFALDELRKFLIRRDPNGVVAQLTYY